MRDRSAARHAGQPRPGAGHCLTGTVSARRQCGGSGGTVCGRKEAIGGGLLESPKLRRAMACAVRRRGGDGVLTTPRCGRCLGYRPGGRYFKYRPPPWVSFIRPIGHVWSRSRKSPLHLPRQTWTLTDPASTPGPRAPPPAMPMPLELLAGSELRRCPAPVLYLRLLAALFPGRREELRRRLHRRRAGAEHCCLAWSLQLPRRKANSGG